MITASGRLDRCRDRADGMTIIHRWVTDDFKHNYDGPCLCNPLAVASDDPRSLDEIMDDMLEEGEAVHA